MSSLRKGCQPRYGLFQHQLSLRSWPKFDYCELTYSHDKPLSLDLYCRLSLHVSISTEIKIQYPNLETIVKYCNDFMTTAYVLSPESCKIWSGHGQTDQVYSTSLEFMLGFNSSHSSHFFYLEKHDNLLQCCNYCILVSILTMCFVTL